MDTLTAAVTLLLVMDPLGNLPIFISALEPVAPPRRRKVLARELLLALAICLGFLFAGRQILEFLGLRQETISIAGGIVLFLIALHMLFPTEGGSAPEATTVEPFLVPLAVPLVAGPSVLATLLLLERSDPGRLSDWLLALVGAWGVTAAVLLSAPLWLRILGRRGLIAFERLMGMLLVMIAVQMFLDGVKRYLAS
jgi:multiple antibiotic resistance protein